MRGLGLKSIKKIWTWNRWVMLPNWETTHSWMKIRKFLNAKVKDWKKNIPAVQKLKFNLRRESGKFSGFYQSLVGFVKTWWRSEAQRTDHTDVQWTGLAWKPTQTTLCLPLKLTQPQGLGNGVPCIHKIWALMTSFTITAAYNYHHNDLPFICFHSNVKNWV